MTDKESASNKHDAFHYTIRRRVRMPNDIQRTNEIHVQNTGKSIQIGRNGAQRGTENAWYENAGHSDYVANTVLHNAWHHLINFVDNLKVNFQCIRLALTLASNGSQP